MGNDSDRGYFLILCQLRFFVPQPVIMGKILHVTAYTSLEEAKIIRAAIGAAGIGIEAFRVGLEVELEHGTRCPDANVTNNHPVLTGKIVIAHLKEALDYYRRLKIMELEVLIHKALIVKDPAKLEKYLKKLAKEKFELSKSEVTLHVMESS